MQIPSAPATASTPLHSAGRSVAGANMLEGRSSVLPAVEQPTESQASTDRRNPANRPTLVDEQVRLYGPFPPAPAHDAPTPDAVAPDVVVDDQSQGQQSQQQSRDDTAAKDAEVTAPTDADSAASKDASGSSPQRSGTDRSTTPQYDKTPDQDKVQTHEQRIEAVRREEITKLAARDREVRAHEAAHSAIGGQYAGAASFSMRQGPNGVNYAVGGEVPIDLSAIPDNPEATLRKMQTVQRAALAPAEPSPADHAVAAQAAQIAQQARAQLLADQANERVAKTEQSSQARAESAQKRADIADRLVEIQNRFNFSDTLTNLQRSREVDFISKRYSPLRPSMIGTLLNETV